MLRCMERGREEAGECGAVVDLASSVQVTRDEPLSLDSPTMKFMQIQPQAADVVLRYYKELTGHQICLISKVNKK